MLLSAPLVLPGRSAVAKSPGPPRASARPNLRSLIHPLEAFLPQHLVQTVRCSSAANTVVVTALLPSFDTFSDASKTCRSLCKLLMTTCDGSTNRDIVT